jgi:hypothetical protein
MSEGSERPVGGILSLPQPDLPPLATRPDRRHRSPSGRAPHRGSLCGRIVWLLPRPGHNAACTRSRRPSSPIKVLARELVRGEVLLAELDDQARAPSTRKALSSGSRAQTTCERPSPYSERTSLLLAEAGLNPRALGYEPYDGRLLCAARAAGPAVDELDRETISGHLAGLSRVCRY